MGIHIAQILPDNPEFQRVLRELKTIYEYGAKEYEHESPWQLMALSLGWAEDLNRHRGKYSRGLRYLEDLNVVHEGLLYFAAYAAGPWGEEIVGVVSISEQSGIVEIHYLVANPFTSGAGEALIEHVLNLHPGCSITLHPGYGTQNYYERLGFHFNSTTFSFILNYPPPPPWYLNDGRYIIRH